MILPSLDVIIGLIMTQQINTTSKLKKINTNDRSNWLRAAVLGSNDGIISIAGLVIGVSGAAQSKESILTAGIAGIIAGAISLGAGEYVSVSAERDMQKALLAKERQDLVNYPKEELNDLVSAYENEGLKPDTAEVVAKEFTEADAFATHAEVDFNIDPKHLTSPWSSVFASSFAFVIGSLIPLSAIMLSTKNYTVIVTFIAVVIALIITGTLTAKVSGTKVLKPVLRVVAGGIIAMVVTYLVGILFKVASV